MDNFLDFRQGIISTSSDNVFRFNDMSKNMVVMNNAQNIYATVAHFKDNYVIKIDSDANLQWNISDGANWLYVDVDLVDGTLSAGVCEKKYSYGTTYPTLPRKLEYFFDIRDGAGYYWSGSKWILCNRIFVASCVMSKINQLFTGSHVNIRGRAFTNTLLNTDNIGISFDYSNRPRIKKEFNKPRTITPSEVQLNLVESTSPSLRAVTDIPSLTCVTISNSGVDICSGNSSTCAGIVVSDYAVGDWVDIVDSGNVHTGNIGWGSVPNIPLFVDVNGTISTNASTSISNQKIGYVVSKHLIHIDTNRAIIFR